MSYMNTKGVKILSTIVRMGRKDTYTDNSTSGGISCGVGKDGRLNTTGFQLSGDLFTSTDDGRKFDTIILPFMDEIEVTVKKLHEKAPHFKIISWDLAINSNEEIVLIEYNIKGQDINFHQLNNGPVLSEILEIL